MACKYVKEFQFGGKVSNSGVPKSNHYADGGKVKSALSSIERKSPQEKQSIADGIANYAGGNKPGLIQRTIDAAKRANPKTTAAMGFEPPPDDYARGGKVFGRGGLPREKGSIQDPSIKPFKRPSRRGKA